MGFLTWLNPLNWFRRRDAGSGATTTTQPSTPSTTHVDTAPAMPAAAPPATRTVSKQASTRAPAPEDARCQAMTAQGTQCKSSSRDNSKYCGRHKGYRAPAQAKPASAAGKTASKTAGKTASKTAPRASSNGSSGQVRHGSYRLYQKGNRYFFSKKTQAEAKAEGAVPVSSMPPGRQVVETPNGLPVLKKA